MKVNERQKISILGAGKIGRAIGTILEKRKCEIEFWDKDTSKVPASKPLAEVIASADILFLCVPSWAMREAVAGALAHLNSKSVIVALAKGIEQTTNKTMDEVLAEFLPRNRFAILGGPMLAKELQKGLNGVGVAGVKSKKICDKIKQLFDGTNLHITCVSDMHGVVLAGVLKNIYAIGLGIADGLSWGNNQKGYFVVAAIKEMAEIISALGGKKETAYSAAGLGDLIATGYSPCSRNRRVGEELVKTGKCCLEYEGPRSLPHITTLLRKRKLQPPFLLAALNNILIRGQDAKTVFENYIKESYT